MTISEGIVLSLKAKAMAWFNCSLEHGSKCAVKLANTAVEHTLTQFDDFRLDTINSRPMTCDLGFYFLSDLKPKVEGWCQNHIKRWSLHYDFIKSRIKFRYLTWLGTVKTTVQHHVCWLVSSWIATIDRPGFSISLMVAGPHSGYHST